MVSKIGRNDLCNCGSGKKHKHCCGKPEGKVVNLQLSSTQMIVCLLRQLGGTADIELEEVAALTKDIKIDVKQNGNTVILGVVESGQSVVALPQEKRIIY